MIEQIGRDLRASIVYALEHRAPALAHASRYQPGNRRGADRHIRRDVRESVDGGLRPPGAARPCRRSSIGAIAAGLIPERVAVDFVG